MYKICDIYIKLEDLKNFIFKKNRPIEGKIIEFKILGITISYTRGKQYKHFVQILEFIKPYITKDIDSLIEQYTKMSKMWKISASQYKKDTDIIKNILEDVNPSIIAPATGELRKIQMKELNFAKELLMEIYQNTGLKPFIDDGTLLGAVRHKGFIPWDDDMDFSLMREDYDKLRKYMSDNHIVIECSNWAPKAYITHLKECFAKHPNKIFCIRRTSSFKCYKGTFDNHCCIDFFALDYYKEGHTTASLQAYANRINRNLSNCKTDVQKFKIIEHEILNGTETVKESNTISVGVDNFDFQNYTIKGIRRKTDIFPLIKMQFEDTEFYAPNNPDAYLKTLYNFYNKIPVNVDVQKHAINK